MDSQYLQTDELFDPQTKQVVNIDEKRFLRIPETSIKDIKKELKMTVTEAEHEQK